MVSALRLSIVISYINIPRFSAIACMARFPPSAPASPPTNPLVRSQYSVLIGLGLGSRLGVWGRGTVTTGLRVGVGIRIRVGFKDSVGVQSGQKFPLGAFGTHGLLRPAPLATDYWPEVRGGGGEGRGSPHTRVCGALSGGGGDGIPTRFSKGEGVRWGSWGSGNKAKQGPSGSLPAQRKDAVGP